MCAAEQLPGQLCACSISVVVFTEEDELMSSEEEASQPDSPPGFNHLLPESVKQV